MPTNTMILQSGKSSVCVIIFTICITRSATNMRWIEEKMKLLGCTNNPNYKLAFYLDSRAMISVETEKYGLVDVKPLGVIWGKYPQYTKQNTIMFDDLRRNFLMNPQNGLKIRPFREVKIKKSEK